MITPEFARTMARYNRWQNTNLTAAGATPGDTDLPFMAAG